MNLLSAIVLVIAILFLLKETKAIVDRVLRCYDNRTRVLENTTEALKKIYNEHRNKTGHES